MKYSKTNPPLVCMHTTSRCYLNTKTMSIKGILIHSTGANNPNLCRCVQPADNDINRDQLISILGKNKYSNDYNHSITSNVGMNAFIGKAADGTVMAVQTMPWNYRPWGCGSGTKGSCNDGWIQFEIMEDNLKDNNYFNAIYQETIELVAYLCKIYNLNPKGYATLNGIQVPVILCHKDSHTLGLGTNHADVMHWFPTYGKDMNTVRDDVQNLLAEITVPVPSPSIPEVSNPSNLTQTQFNLMMETYLNSLGTQKATFEQEALTWAQSEGIMSGEPMPKKFLTRGEFIVVLKRFYDKYMTK